MLRSDVLLKDPPAEDEPIEAEIVEGEEEDWAFDDDDFWNALDLMETSVKILTRMLRAPSLGAMCRKLIENHTDDLMQFLSQFYDQEGGDV